MNECHICGKNPEFPNCTILARPSNLGIVLLAVKNDAGPPTPDTSLCLDCFVAAGGRVRLEDGALLERHQQKQMPFADIPATDDDLETP